MLRIWLLGEMRLEIDGAEVAAPSSRRGRLLLAMLALDRRPQARAALAGRLWPEVPDDSARVSLRTALWQLRSALGAEADRFLSVTRDHAALPGDEAVWTDVGECERLLAEDDVEGALELFRGELLSGFEDEWVLERRDELRDRVVDALRGRADAAEAAGDLAAALALTRRQVALDPLSEEPQRELIRRLAAGGDRAAAVAAYDRFAERLRTQLRTAPSAATRELVDAVRSGAAPTGGGRDEPPAAAPAPVPATGPAERARRLVSVLFAEVVGSAALAERLDPEAMHGLLDRYSSLCEATVGRHGGTIERFAGNAVMGAFGIAEVHEDDGLRAVRAAIELRAASDALGAELERDHGLGLGVKLGLDAGEVFVAAGARGETFATGDAVHVAEGLGAAAAAGEILLGDRIHRLVEPEVEVEPLAPVAVVGRSASVGAWRLIGIRSEEPAALHAPATPMIDREPALAELRAALDRARGDSACELVTVLGPPGIGKSRLARELAAAVGESATVVVGRCLSYGEAITYWPLAEIVRQLGGSDPRARLAELLAPDPRADAIARRIVGAIGRAAEPAAAEETFAAVRRLFERLAGQRPLVVVVEDIHWAEPTLLDLLEYVAGFSRGAPILLVGLARPELLDQRPAWTVPQSNRAMVVLDALSRSEGEQVVTALAGPAIDADTLDRIVATAEGNPLFLEQLAAVGAESGGGALPPSIKAVLAARIDRLEHDERQLLECAAVEGPTFHSGALADLVPERGEISTRLLSLVRKQLIQSDQPVFDGEDAFRFAHALIREVAYDGLPKRRRAELHERVAAWLETKPGAQDEIVGHHLAQACGYWSDLGLVGERERALAVRAADRLAAAAAAASLRGDPRAAASLLERAVALLDSADPARPSLLHRLGVALFDAGSLAEADRVLVEAAELGDARLEAHARVDRQLVLLQTQPETAVAEARRVADSALQLLADYDDDFGQCRAWCLRASVDWTKGHMADADAAWQQAATHAQRSGDERELFEILGWRAAAAVFGPLPVADGIRLCDTARDRVKDSPVATALILHPLASLHAMAGDFDHARELIAEGNRILAELGRLQQTVSHHETLVEVLAGRPDEAERKLRPGYLALDAMGEHLLRATTAALLAQAVYAQGRQPEAAELCLVSEQTAAEDDIAAQTLWRGVSAQILAEQGEIDAAEELAREAVRLAEQTDLLTTRADALLDLAVVLRRTGRGAEAEAAARDALDIYVRKGSRVGIERARARLDETAPT